MDENKEKELLGEDKLSEEEAAKVSDILENLRNKDAESDTVTDWDGLAEVGSSAEIIEENVTEEEEKEEIEVTESEEEEELCIKCEKRPRYTEIDENYLYCKACREDMKKTRLNPWAVLSLLFAIVMGFIALVWGIWALAISIPVIKGDMDMLKGDTASAIENYMGAVVSVEQLASSYADAGDIFDVGEKTYEKFKEAYSIILKESNKKGDEFVAQKKYQSAINCYTDAIVNITSLSSEYSSEAISNLTNEVCEETYAKIIRAYALLGSPANASVVTVGQNQIDCYSQLETIGSYEKEEYADVKEYYDIYNGMMDTYYILTQQIYINALNQFYVSIDTNKFEDVKKYVEELEEYKKDEQYDKYMVSYVQSIFCAMTTDGDDERAKYLEEVKSGGRLYEFIYAQELSVAYLDLGEHQKAEDLCYEVIKESPENYDVYQYLMISKTRQGDYDGAIALADKVEDEIEEVYLGENATDSASAMPHTIMMEKAIAYALKGDKNKALAAIDLSYQLGNDNSNLNIYLLLHYLYHVKGTEPTTDEDGNTVYDNVDGAYDQAELTINTYGAYYGLSLSDNIEAIIDGKKTLEDVFVKGEVEW